MEELEFQKKYKEFKQIFKKKGLAKALYEIPQGLLFIRLSMNKSQREFIKLLDNVITQVSLIRYERGEWKKIKKKLHKICNKLLKREIKLPNWKVLWKRYKNFKRMQKGHLTSERGKLLQQLWIRKTTKEQRKLWGLQGALVANKKAKFTRSEAKIRNLLFSSGVTQVKTHENVPISRDIILNVDFTFNLNSRPVFIEVCERRNNLFVICEALALRSILLKERFPNSITVCVVHKKVPLMGRKILEKFFNVVVLIDNLQKLENFLKVTLSSKLKRQV